MKHTNPAGPGVLTGQFQYPASTPIQSEQLGLLFDAPVSSDDAGTAPKGTDGNVARALLGHYVEALSWRRRGVAWFVALSTLATVAISILLLFAAPKYTAQAIVTMLPSDSELQYTQNWIGRSRIDPVTVSTQTHLEYLNSRPVLEQTLDNVLAKYEATPATGWRAALREGMSAASGWVWKVYLFANYGKAVEVPEHEQQLAELKSRITITPMMASYILLIEADFPDPNLSALVANELAQAYVVRSGQDGQASAEALQTFLDAQISVRQAELDLAGAELVGLRRDTSSFDAASRFAPGLETEKAELDDARRRLAELQARMAAGDTSETSQKLEAALVERIDRLELGMAQSQVRELEATQRQARIDSLERRTAALTDELAQLRDRRLTIDLSTADALSRIQIIEPAQPPLFPSSPKVLNMGVTALVASLILAFTAMMTMDLFSDKVTTSQQLAGLTNRKVLGGIRRSQLVRAENSVPSSQVLAMAKTVLQDLELRKGKPPKLLRVTSLGDNRLDEALAETLRDAFLATGCSAQVVANQGELDGVYSQSLPIVASKGTDGPAVVIFPASLPTAPGVAAGTALLCAVPAARMPEDRVSDFARHADASGAAPIWFVMAESP